MKKIRKIIALTAAALTLFSVCSAVASADWYDEVSGGSYSAIVGEPYVAETFCGVEARYSLTTAQYQCNELIMRFYREAYGLEVMAYMNIGLVMLTEGYEFKTPSTPKKGDIIYSPAKFRQNKSDHWAIVKDYSNGKITLFEQNVVWNGKAGTGRKLNFPSDYYYIYTPVAKAGYPEPSLNGAQPKEHSLTLSKKEITATAGTKEYVDYTIGNAQGGTYDISWKISDESVVSADIENGRIAINPLKDGTATITFTLSNAEKTKVYDAQTLKVTVGSGGDSSMNWLSLIMSFVNLVIKVFTMILGMIG
ncbi:MAG: Ig-like domain-containing protein [Clostridia bacterium]|nr:Ig-like domain-containing protein [Clostridia bacterium]